jgi:hypothetical protein
LKADRDDGKVVAIQIADLPLDFAGRNAVIASHERLDIATFRITSSEIAKLGKTILTGYQRGWPPPPPQRDRGVYFGGFPGKETIWMSPEEISFGAAPGGGVASSISETDVSTLIERENLIPIFGKGLPSEGVIYLGPSPSDNPEQSIAGLQIIKARRAHFILPDGTLDTRRWEEVSPTHAR